MAYYNNYPILNQNYPYGNFQQPIQQVQQPVQPTIQQGGFIPVSSEKEAFDYLVAQGTSVTFIDGKNSKMYVKTRGFSPVEQPIFKRYNLVEIAESENTPEQEKATPVIEYAEKSEIEALRGEIKRINSIVEEMSVKDKENE